MTGTNLPLYVVTARMPGPGLRTLHGREFLGLETEDGEAMEAPSHDTLVAEPGWGGVRLRQHGPLYTAEHVADLEASLLVLARAVVRSADGPAPSSEPCEVAEQVLREAHAGVAP